MSLKRNTIANYVGRFYVALIGIAIVPVYLTYLGKESYGLVAVYSMAQGWMQLLDMGLSTTVAREAACYNAGKYSGSLFKKLFSYIGSFFICSAVAIAGVGVLASGWVAENWLNIEHLPIKEVEYSLAVVAIAVAARWASGPFRSVLLGFERQVIFNILSIIFATLRFVAVIPAMIFFGKNLMVYFTWQLFCSLFELFTFGMVCARFLPKNTEPANKEDFKLLVRPVIKFALSIAFTSAVWVFVTQLDKLILSRLLPIGEYGIFSMMVMAASGITILSAPVGEAIMPRLTVLKEKSDICYLNKIYNQSTQLITVIVAPISMVLAFYSEFVIYLWTGNSSVATSGASILLYYALGNGLLALSALPYYLQYAYGNVRLHVIGNVIFAVILLPSIIIAARNYGTFGAAIVWFVQNLLFFVCWVWIIHKQFLLESHLKWFLSNVAPIYLTSLISVVVSYSLFPMEISKVNLSFFEIIKFGVIIFTIILLTALSSSFVRARFFSILPFNTENRNL